MNTKDLILGVVRKKGRVRTSEIVRRTHLTRQGVAKHLRELTDQNKLVKVGSTRSAVYLPFVKGRKSARSHFTSRFKTQGLNEDEVFKLFVQRAGLREQLSKPAFQIVKYAFTEMLNNAIEHSHSQYVKAKVSCEKGFIEFQVIDHGIGAFESIRRKFKFRDHKESAEHLLKGKQTVAPKHHTGQGIFFTSKIADIFRLQSAELSLEIDNLRLKDIFLLPSEKKIKGTQIFFLLKQRSKKNLKELFDQYTNANFEFDKTIVTVRLSAQTGGYVSRSEARRILFGLEKFKRIVMDFKDVIAVGQGFVDEVFRVFRLAHPDIQIEPIHMSGTVAFMVNRGAQS